jgi:hypothetical protein
MEDNSEDNSEREMGRSSPLACVPGAIATEERPSHFALLRRLFTERMREHKEAVDGYTFRFDATAYEDVVNFVNNERLCCPFLTFRIDCSAHAGSLWLTMRGPVGTRDFLDAELPSFKR